MKFKKLNDNKIQIILNLNDLEKHNISFDSFMSNTIQAQQLLIHILDEIEKELNFSFENYKLIIETIAISNTTFILTVSRLNFDNSYSRKYTSKHQKDFGITNYTSSKEFLCVPEINNDKDFKYVYVFNSFEAFHDFYKLIFKDDINKKRIKIIEYKKNYYLILTINHKQKNNFKKFFALLPEFSTPGNSSVSSIAHLIEFGTPIKLF